jgi:hypothetical protein
MLTLALLLACRHEAVDGEPSTHGDSAAPSATLGVVWEAVGDAETPVLPDCPTWNCLGYTDPTVVRAPDGRVLVWGSVGGDDPDGPAIGRSVLTGDTLAFSPDAPVISPDPFDEDDRWDRVRETVHVRWNADAGAWDLWYLGYRTDFFTDPAIGHTRSLDAEGTQWAHEPEPLYRPAVGAWDANFLSGPSVVQGPDGRWYLYYIGASFAVDAKKGVGLLTSDDGERWTPEGDGPVFEATPDDWDADVIDAVVIVLQGRFYMYYSAFTGDLDFEQTPIAIGLATSDDGVTWERHGPPVISPEPGTWYDLRVLDPDILIEEDGSLLMVGYGSSYETADQSSLDFAFGLTGLWRSVK